MYPGVIGLSIEYIFSCWFTCDRKFFSKVKRILRSRLIRLCVGHISYGGQEKNSCWYQLYGPFSLLKIVGEMAIDVKRGLKR